MAQTNDGTLDREAGSYAQGDTPISNTAWLDELLSPQIMNEDTCFECCVNFTEAKQAITEKLKDIELNMAAKYAATLSGYNMEITTLKAQIAQLEQDYLEVQEVLNQEWEAKLEEADRKAYQAGAAWGIKKLEEAQRVARCDELELIDEHYWGDDDTDVLIDSYVSKHTPASTTHTACAIKANSDGPTTCCMCYPHEGCEL